MKNYKIKKSAIAFLTLCIAFILSAKAQESDKSPVTGAPPRLILKQLIQTSGLKEQEVKVVIVEFAPGETSTAHRHPIPTFGYVLEGELESTFDGKVYHYKTGEAFYERPNGLHSGTRNMSKDKPAKLVAFFVGDKGKPFLVPEKE
ncbi:cupin domain-containing protein [Mucilaginibacter sabulilitoris]|uniref:Cupin domain-containing protein n=1 Tax=Mucilaginibacter sabulilitoris TaxID=1173583 RepID=A0ABZ0TCH9_9SPHI|nr:cupin domain-containing protein [Mucilaginibacter sabulilitoris]WPU90929.1 cupin domain-containing protein [Mucilaginibacter sabulilitoris]